MLFNEQAVLAAIAAIIGATKGADGFLFLHGTKTLTNLASRNKKPQTVSRNKTIGGGSHTLQADTLPRVGGVRYPGENPKVPVLRRRKNTHESRNKTIGEGTDPEAPARIGKNIKNRAMIRADSRIARVLASRKKRKPIGQSANKTMGGTDPELLPDEIEIDGHGLAGADREGLKELRGMICADSRFTRVLPSRKKKKPIDQQDNRRRN
ncbi:hypothetical protein C4D60_Mb06t14270 [Musa balbisiana]|uniref:Uncharacterized protein n=1 Tax=Musa balbisiana TaxID=52838 RepID=A0A4S8IN01_MUSBA|nr:hypothetical protein C4D60_Mb06t14270 [Musa balbisiana]